MERQDNKTDCRDPDAVEYLAKLSTKDARLHPPVIRTRSGGYTAYWRDGKEVRWREITASELPEFGRNPAAPSAELAALMADVETRYAELLPKLVRAASQKGADIDSIERALRDGALGNGGVGLKVILEHVDSTLKAPECRHCGRKMVRHRRAAKTFTTRLGDVEIIRTYFLCRDCGGGFYLLDRMIGAEGDNCTAGATSIMAEAAAICSYAPATGLLRNLAGVLVSPSALQRRVRAIGNKVEQFERVIVEGAAPAASRQYLAMDGTGVPMRQEETKGIRGKQEDGSSKTREAKVVIAYTAQGRSPKTGEVTKDKGSETVSAAIDSAAAIGGVSARSDFAARLGRLIHRTGLGDAEEVVVLSDGATWIVNVCQEMLPGPRITYVLDLWHALDYAGDALKVLVADQGERKRRIEEIRDELKAGRVHEVIAWLEPFRDRGKDVAACIDYYRNNQDRMQYDQYIRRGMQVGSGVVESLGRQLVGKRLKQPGSHWTKAGANRLMAIKACLHNNRWADYLDWNANRALAA